MWTQGMPKAHARKLRRALKSGHASICEEILHSFSPTYEPSENRLLKEYDTLKFPIKKMLAKAIEAGFGTGMNISPDTEIPAPNFLDTATDYIASSQPFDAWRKSTFKSVDQAELVQKTLKLSAQCEAQNYKTNQVFSRLHSYDTEALGRGQAELIHLMREEISYLLSDFSAIKTLRFCHHGKGTTATTGRPLHEKIKELSATPCVAEARYSSVYCGLEGYLPQIVVVPAERFATVEKTYKIRRPIGIQPSLNLWFQLGVGGWMKTQFKSKWKLDLTNQQRNRDLAELGSKYDSLVTIDLTSASDLISYELVCYLLEHVPEFLAYIKDLRVAYSEYPGVSMKNEKFSSMGNGYTFELETLIFTAAVRAVYRMRDIPLTDVNWAVYGDDMIVEKECAPELIKLLTTFGFSINTDKSFLSGPFRESCGADFFDGVPVRNFFIKETIDDEKSNLHTIIKICNSVYRCFQASEQRQEKFTYITIWESLFSSVPKWVQRLLVGPPVEHDGWFITNNKALHSESHTNYVGDDMRLAVVEVTKKLNRNGKLERDAWYYLANRREPLLHFIKPRAKVNLEKPYHYNKATKLVSLPSSDGYSVRPVFTGITYRPSKPSGTAIKLIVHAH
jgi:hypothetical protein